jgi:hypothetical protein
VLLFLWKADSWGCITFSLEGVLINVQHTFLEIVFNMMNAEGLGCGEKLGTLYDLILFIIILA